MSPALSAPVSAPSAPSADSDTPGWTCPFCPLLCDGLPRPVIDPQRAVWTLPDIACSRAQAALQAHPLPGARPTGEERASPRVDGQPAALDVALDAAAALLRGARQPLATGLATDVAGARALYRLQAACGAISDVAAGASVMAGLRALQDRGGYSTSLAELRSRADRVLVLGRPPLDSAPRLFVRPSHGLDGAPIPPHRGAVLGAALGDAARCAAAPGAPQLDEVAPGVDLPTLLAELTVWVGGRRPAVARPALEALAGELRAARYVVLVLETKPWGADAGLLVEAANRLVAALNVQGRAALLSLGGGDGAASVCTVQTWLSGLPVRSRAGADGLAHEPLAWDTDRLLRPTDGGAPAVDALLWVSSFGVQPALPAVPPELPLIALQTPGAPLPVAADRHAPTIVIPVASPGIGHAGHLVRTDGSVMLPLQALHDDGLPTVAAVADALLARLRPQWLPPADPGGGASAAHATVAAETEVRHG